MMLIRVKLLLALLLATTGVSCSKINGVKQSVGALELSNGSLHVGISPSLGGRITSLQWQGQELLLGRDETKAEFNNWGSTFWLSPQSLWGWPPISQHDSEPYQILEQKHDRVSLISREGGGAVVEKTVSLSADQINKVNLQYTISAAKTFPQIAAWQISRVPKTGVVFFLATPGSINTSMGKVEYQQGKGNLVVVDLEKNVSEGKLIANGLEGWIAWLNDGKLFVKSYQSIDWEDMATGEGDIEIYISDKHPYAEVEVQSAAQKLNQGEQLKWQVSWWVLDQIKPDVTWLELKALVRDGITSE